MDIEIRHGPAYALAIAHLGEGEQVIAESGAMVSKDSHVEIQTSTGGGGGVSGLMKGLRRVVGGESFFQNRYLARGAAGHVTFAPTLQGDITVHRLNSNQLFLQSTSFLCAEEGVEVSATWGGAKSFFAGEGLILLKTSGTGLMAFNSFGGIRSVDVKGSFLVDTGHIVAFEDSLHFEVQSFGRNKGINWKALLLGGEGLVCKFQGEGRLWLQTRNTQGFGKLIGTQLPPRSS